jgi:phage portal protein BeeE
VRSRVLRRRSGNGRSKPTLCITTDPPETQEDDDLCVEDVTLVSQTGVTDFPFVTDAVKIISQDTSTVTIDLHQAWTTTSATDASFGATLIDAIYVAYKESVFSQKCLANENVQGDGFLYETLTVQCNMLTPKTHIEICVQDEIVLQPEQDNATIPKCCHSERGGDEASNNINNAPVACYVLEINCETECVDELQGRNRNRNLRGAR